jgi:hypothetical protein
MPVVDAGFQLLVVLVVVDAGVVVEVGEGVEGDVVEVEGVVEALGVGVGVGEGVGVTVGVADGVGVGMVEGVV